MLKSSGASLRPCRNWKASGILCRHDLRYQQQGCGDATCVSNIGLHSADVIMTNRKRDGLIRAAESGERRVRQRLKRTGLMSVCGNL